LQAALFFYPSAGIRRAAIWRWLSSPRLHYKA